MLWSVKKMKRLLYVLLLDTVHKAKRKLFLACELASLTLIVFTWNVNKYIVVYNVQLHVEWNSYLNGFLQSVTFKTCTRATGMQKTTTECHGMLSSNYRNTKCSIYADYKTMMHSIRSTSRWLPCHNSSVLVIITCKYERMAVQSTGSVISLMLVKGLLLVVWNILEGIRLCEGKPLMMKTETCPVIGVLCIDFSGNTLNALNYSDWQGTTVLTRVKVSLVSALVSQIRSLLLTVEE